MTSLEKMDPGVFDSERLGNEEYEGKVPESNKAPVDQKGKSLEEVNSLAAARNVRRKAETDLQAIENRILLLKKEEERAKIRINQTKKRAEEIVKMREENIRRKKMMQAQRLSQERSGANPDIVKQRFIQKEIAKAARKKHLIDIHATKKSRAQQFRSEKKKFEKDVSVQKRAAQEDAKRKSEAIRKQREEAMKKIHRQKEEKRLKSRIEYEQKVQQEKAVAKRCETKAQKLERLEAELIQRLQHTQKVQRQAYCELESALSPKQRMALKKKKK